jgi:hypothetical protein
VDPRLFEDPEGAAGGGGEPEEGDGQGAEGDALEQALASEQYVSDEGLAKTLLCEEYFSSTSPVTDEWMDECEVRGRTRGHQSPVHQSIPFEMLFLTSRGGGRVLGVGWGCFWTIYFLLAANRTSTNERVVVGVRGFARISRNLAALWCTCSSLRLQALLRVWVCLLTRRVLLSDEKPRGGQALFFTPTPEPLFTPSPVPGLPPLPGVAVGGGAGTGSGRFAVGAGGVPVPQMGSGRRIGLGIAAGRG